MTKEKRKYLMKSFTIMIVVFIIMVISIIWYSNHLRSSFNDEIIYSLSEISELSTAALNKDIEGELNGLLNIADLLGSHSDLTVADMVPELRLLQNNSEFKRLGVIDSRGKAYATDGVCLDLSDRDFYDLAMKGESNVSDTLIDKTDGTKINVYGVPIYRDGAVMGVLFGTQQNELYQQRIEIKTFEGDGYSYVVKKNGDTVVASSHETSFRQMTNILEAVRGADDWNKECCEELKRSMDQGKTGYITFKNKVKKYMYYRPIGVNDWYLLTVIPTRAVSEKMDQVMMATYILFTGVVLFFTVLMLLITRGYYKNRKDLEKIVYIDSVTGGATFEKFRKETEKLLLKPEKYQYAVIDMDIDKFKLINDVFGYEEGNIALRFIWDTLNSFIRGGETCAHRTADSFVALVWYDSREELMNRLDKLCRDLAKPHRSGRKAYEIVPSIGIYTIYKKRKLEAMLDRAAIARKEIKGKHNNPYAFYDDAIRQKLVREKYIEDKMTDALEHDEFFVCYQPKYDVNTRKVTGAEALVRWRDPDAGIVSPGEFIPIFESNGFVIKLDIYVFEQVCRQMRGWLDQGKKVVPVSVNLSQMHLHNEKFVEEYRAIMERYHIPANLLQLELTESALFEHEDILTDVIMQLHLIGFAVLMDDFGTGYSSLHMLKNVPVDVLKLDKKFVDDIGEKRSEHVIESIINLAHSLGMKVVAEGVEIKKQYLFLKNALCDEIQGYYFSKPISEKEYSVILDQIE